MKWTFHWTSSVPSRTVHLTVLTGDGYRCASLQPGHPPHTTSLGPVPTFKNPQEYSHHPGELSDHHSAYVRSNTSLEMMSQDSAAPLWGTGRTLSAATLAHRGPIDGLGPGTPSISKKQAQQGHWMMGRSRKELWDTESSPSRLPVMSLS